MDDSERMAISAEISAKHAAATKLLDEAHALVLRWEVAESKESLEEEFKRRSEERFPADEADSHCAILTCRVDTGDWHAYVYAGEMPDFYEEDADYPPYCGGATGLDPRDALERALADLVTRRVEYEKESA